MIRSLITQILRKLIDKNVRRRNCSSRIISVTDRKYKEFGLSTDYLKATAGVELFNTDGEEYDPAEEYVLNSLVKAEEELNKYLKNPSKLFKHEDMIHDLLELEKKIVNEGPVTLSDLDDFSYIGETMPDPGSNILYQRLLRRIFISMDKDLGSINDCFVEYEFN